MKMSCNREKCNPLRKAVVIKLPYYVYKAVPRSVLWVFMYGTRVVEFLNTLFLAGFGVIMLFEAADLVKVGKTYSYFALVTNPLFWWGMVALAVLQFASMCYLSNRSNLFSGIVLQASAVTWVSIALIFGWGHPPLTPSFPIYLFFGVMCCCAGLILANTAKAQEDNNGNL